MHGRYTEGGAVLKRCIITLIALAIVGLWALPAPAENAQPSDKEKEVVARQVEPTDTQTVAGKVQLTDAEMDAITAGRSMIMFFGGTQIGSLIGPGEGSLIVIRHRVRIR